MIVAGSLLALVGLFLLGVALVIWCVEVFIEAVAQSAVSLGISGFFLAVLLAGVDVENAILGVVAAFVELPGLALGTVFGESLFVLAVAVGLAAIFVPFRMPVPRTYLLLLVVVPLPAYVLSIGGTIDRADGAVLTGLFLVLLVYIFRHEHRSETKYLVAEEIEAATGVETSANGGATTGDERPASEERTVDGSASDRASDDAVEQSGNGTVERSGNDAVEEEGGKWVPDLDPDEFVPELAHRSGPFNLGVAILAIVGMTIGSAITVLSAEGIFATLGISGLAFGATVLSVVASIEELALTVEPVRQERPHLAVGNVVGSTVFYTTANVGIIALLHPISTTGAVMTVHWPFLASCLLVVIVMLARGRVTRPGGILLLGLYGAYWVANYA